jgi:hypothetical protein
MNFILHMDVNNLEEIYTIEEQSFIGRLPEFFMLMHLRASIGHFLPCKTEKLEYCKNFYPLPCRDQF